MKSNSVHCFVLFGVVWWWFLVLAFISEMRIAECDTSPVEVTQCRHSLKSPSSFFKRHFDVSFLKKFFKHWIPFTSSSRVKMQFFLYKSDFPECGRELQIDDDEVLALSGFNADHPTRVIIHGWMSQSKGSFNRAVKNAYLSLTKPQSSSDSNDTTAATEAPASASETDTTDASVVTTEIVNNHNNDNSDNSDNSSVITDYNVIVVDWSIISTNVNYFGVVDLIDDLGFLLAEFIKFLHMRGGLQFRDVYLIGHSLGAQIAGSAGRHVRPYRFKTIFALDPAGPKFRDLPDDQRIDPSDAEYVESIQTSSSLGFEDPVGHATFYPNFGRDQKKCYIYGCSHSRAHEYFAESITSREGFWGTLCQRQSETVWHLSDTGAEFRMGGEPSTPKRGTFYVKTNAKPPYAMGRHGNSNDNIPI